MTYTAFIWTYLVLIVYSWPKQELTEAEETAFIILIVPKGIYEMSILVVFLSLFRVFNNLSKDYQAEKKAESSNIVRCQKIMATVICLLYGINTILQNVVSPYFLYLNLKDRKDGIQVVYSQFLL